MLTAKHNSHHAAIRTVHKLILYPETHPFSLYILYTLASQQDGSETNPRRPCSWPSALSINKPISTPNSDVLACCTLLFFGHTGTWVWRQWIQPVKEKCCLTPVLLSGKIPRTDEPGGLKSMGLQKSQTRLSMCVYPIRWQRTLQPPRHYTYSCPNCEPWGNSGQNKMPTIKSSTTTALPFNPACAYTHTHTRGDSGWKKHMIPAPDCWSASQHSLGGFSSAKPSVSQAQLFRMWNVPRALKSLQRIHLLSQSPWTPEAKRGTAESNWWSLAVNL